MEYYLLTIPTFAFGFIIGYLINNGKLRSVTTRVELLEKQLAETKEQHQQEILTLKEEFKEQTLKQLELMKNELTIASQNELRGRTEDLSKMNKEELDKILIPLNQNILQMKEAAEKSQQNQTETTASLRQFVETTREETEKLGTTTNNLVNALSQNNKYQGSFGEMQLHKLLENFGFVKGIHFDEQVNIRDEYGEAIKHDETGKGLEPDVVLHFPDHRDIIIDAKTPMTAFMRYNDSTLTDAEKKQAIKDHITAVRGQVKDLSKKTYWQHYNRLGIKLDFVVMFISSESAMQLAITEEPTLWKDSFDQGIFIAGPQNLYALLKLLEISWKQVAQIENQQKIIECAEDIVKRVQIFRDRYENVRNTLKKAVNEGFHGLDSILADKGKSIIISARNLLDYGASEDRKRKTLKADDGRTLLEANVDDQEEENANESKQIYND